MTWKEFKTEVEQGQGVKDDDRFDQVDPLWVAHFIAFLLKGNRSFIFPPQK